MANNLGVAAGAAAGGTLAAAWSYRAVFWVDARAFFLFAAVVAWGVPDPFRERLLARENPAAAGPGLAEEDPPAYPSPAGGRRGAWSRWSRGLSDLYGTGLVSVVLLGLASLGLFFVYAQLQTVLPASISRLGFT